MRELVLGRLWQNLCLLLCLLFGLAIILNVELAGNPMWYWYDVLFHGGAKLYADLHLALQPLFVLETNAWMRISGNRVLPMEILSLIHLVVLCLGIQLLARETGWPDWEKGILLAGSFLIFTHFYGYLFDDFHVVSDIFWIYSYVLLLKLARKESSRQLLGLAAVLGVLSGLAITMRLNDGVALVAGSAVCVLFLARKRKLMGAVLLVVAAALTVLLVIRTTGDTPGAWLTNSVLRAAGSKGGTSNFLADPVMLLRNTLEVRHGKKWIFLWLAAMVGAGYLMERYWKGGTKWIPVVQFGMAGLAYALASAYNRKQLRSDELLIDLSFCSTVVIYGLVPLVAAHFLISRAKGARHTWDAREVLVLPLFFWLAAASASTGGRPENFFPMLAFLFLLIALIYGQGRRGWVSLSLVTILVLVGAEAVATRAKVPYAWQNYVYPPMFESRVWYRHPTLGPMYMEKDQLSFIQPICNEIENGDAKPELLSLPFPYPNYFCGTPPWHGYVQTFFDTSTRETIERMMGELDTAPPKWILYQRQLKILALHEWIFNHNRPLAQRDLDAMIVRKVTAGQWQVVYKSDYLYTDPKLRQEGDGWYLIRTRP